MNTPTPTPRTDEFVTTWYHYNATPRTDEFIETWDHYNDPFEAIDHAQTLERELTAAQEKIEMMNIRHGAAAMHHDHNMGEVMEQRDEFHVKIEELAIKLQAVTEQRDRLAETLRKIKNASVSPCSISSFLLEGLRHKDPAVRVMKWLAVFNAIMVVAFLIYKLTA